MKGWVARATLVALLGAAAYAVSLTMMVPARFVAKRTQLPGEIIDVSGTIWNGQVILRDEYTVRWTVSPLQSLLHLALAADWTMSGADTALAGRAALRSGSVTLTDVEGRAGWGLARAALPDLTVICDGSVAVSLQSVTLANDRQGAVGQFRSGPANCSDTGRAPADTVETPPLTGVSSDDGDTWSIRFARSAEPDKMLADVAIRDRLISITFQPEAARLFKSLPTSGPITMEFPY